MVDPRLLDYVKSVKEKGHSDNAIKEHLVKHGHHKDAVEELFKHPDLNTKPKEEKSKPKTGLFLVILLIIIVLGGLGAVFFLKPIVSSECEEVSITLHQINNEDVLCVFPDNSKIQTILKNNGKKIINSVTLLAKGDKGKVQHNVENLILVENDIKTLVLDYNSGNLKQITITPTILVNQEVIVCKDKVTSYENIKTC